MAKKTGGIKIQKQSSEGSQRRELSLVESSYVDKKGRTRRTLGIAVNGVVAYGQSRGAQHWQDTVAMMRDGGLDVIAEWAEQVMREERN